MTYRDLESYWSPARSFYKTDAWRELAKQCKIRDGYTCKLCGFQAETIEERKQLHAHHKISRRPTPCMTALDRLDNLETICIPCHSAKHGRNLSPLKAKPKLFRARSKLRRPF